MTTTTPSTTGRRRFLIGAAAGLACSTAYFAGTGRAHAANPPLVFWSQLAGSKKAAGEALEASFAAAHPDVALSSSLYAEPAQLNEKMLTAINGNTGPDLIVQHWDFNLIYAAGNKLADLGAIDTSALDPALLAYGKHDGTVFSVPLYGTSRGLGINRKLIAEAGMNPDIGPKNWAELREWAKAATQRSGPMLRTAGIQLYQNDLEAFELFTLLLQGAGGTLLTPDGTGPAFAGPEGLKALTFIRDLVTVDRVTDPGFAVGSGGMSNPFNQGRSAMLIAGNYSTNNALKGGIEFDVLPIPMENGGFTSLVDPFCFAVRGGSDSRQAAMGFIEHALTPESQIAFALASKNVPSLAAAQAHPDVVADPYLSKFVAVSRHAPAEAPATPAFSRLMTLVSRAVQEVVYGRTEPEAALASAAAEVSTVMQRV